MYTSYVCRTNAVAGVCRSRGGFLSFSLLHLLLLVLLLAPSIALVYSQWLLAIPRLGLPCRLWPDAVASYKNLQTAVVVSEEEEEDNEEQDVRVPSLSGWFQYLYTTLVHRTTVILILMIFLIVIGGVSALRIRLFYSRHGYG